MEKSIRLRGIRATLLVGATCAVFASSEQQALALQGGEDPALLPVLIDKRFGHDGRHQTSLLFTTSMVTKFVESLGVYAAYQYNFSDLFGLEFSGGYFFGSETNIMQEVRENFPGQEPPLSDLYQLQWMGNLDLMITPIYGKMSFASEFDPSFDLFLVLGGGVAGTRRKTTVPEGHDTKVSPAFNFGLGLRFYFNRLVALRLEFRDYFYPDPQESGLTWNLHFQGGVQFAFGGDS